MKRCLILVLVLLSLAVSVSAQSNSCSLEQVVKDVGTITQPSDTTPSVVIFEEAHDSILGQLQSSVMMVRLHKQCGLNFVGLEGAFPEDGNLDASWFHVRDENKRDQLIVNLLTEGEISQAEAMALAYNNIVVQGIDDSSLYYAPSDSGAAVNMLFVMSIVYMSPQTYQKFDGLVKQINALDSTAADYEQQRANLVDQYIQIVFRSNDWISQQYDKVTDPSIISADALISEMQTIIQRAESMRSDIQALGANPDDYINPLKELLKFYQDADKRSNFMADQMIALHAKQPNAMLSMVIGAAHTDLITQMMNSKSIPTAVIAPLALSDTQNTYDLSTDAYTRKFAQTSVDDATGLGAFLDGRSTQIKPQSVLNEPWFQAKAYIYSLIDVVATVYQNGDGTPEALRSAIAAEIGDSKYASINYDTIKPIADSNGTLRTTFEIKLNVPGSQVKSVWVSARHLENATQVDLEEMLLEAIQGVLEPPKPPSEPPQPGVQEPPPEKHITSSTAAAFGNSRDAVQAVRGI